jgi:hypothetical protein
MRTVARRLAFALLLLALAALARDRWRGDDRVRPPAGVNGSVASSPHDGDADVAEELDADDAPPRRRTERLVLAGATLPTGHDRERLHETDRAHPRRGP